MQSIYEYTEKSNIVTFSDQVIKENCLIKSTKNNIVVNKDSYAKFYMIGAGGNGGDSKVEYLGSGTYSFQSGGGGSSGELKFFNRYNLVGSHEIIVGDNNSRNTLAFDEESKGGVNANLNIEGSGDYINSGGSGVSDTHTFDLALGQYIGASGGGGGGGIFWKKDGESERGGGGGAGFGTIPTGNYVKYGGNGSFYQIADIVTVGSATMNKIVLSTNAGQGGTSVNGLYGYPKNNYDGLDANSFGAGGGGASIFVRYGIIKDDVAFGVGGKGSNGVVYMTIYTK